MARASEATVARPAGAAAAARRAARAAAARAGAPSRGARRAGPARRVSGPARPGAGPARRVSGPARPEAGAARRTAARPAGLTGGFRLAAPGVLAFPARVLDAPFGRAARARTGSVLDALLRGRGWIALVGVLLVGIVFFNVDLLRLNRQLARTTTHASAVSQENARLRLELARLDSSERVQRAAARLGLALPAPGDVRYLRARPTVDARMAAKHIAAPSAGFAAGPPGAAAAPGAAANGAAASGAAPALAPEQAGAGGSATGAPGTTAGPQPAQPTTPTTTAPAAAAAPTPQAPATQSPTSPSP